VNLWELLEENFLQSVGKPALSKHRWMMCMFDSGRWWHD